MLVVGATLALTACPGKGDESYLGQRWDRLSSTQRDELCAGWATQADRLISVLGQDEYRGQLADKALTPADIRTFMDEHC